MAKSPGEGEYDSNTPSAILASFLLDEKLGRLGICGCASCIIGSVIIVLHAPSDPEVETVDEILSYAAKARECH